MLKRFILRIIKDGIKKLLQFSADSIPKIMIGGIAAVITGAAIVYVSTQIFVRGQEIVSPVYLGPTPTPTPNLLLEKIQHTSTKDRKFPPNEFFPRSMTPVYGGQIVGVGGEAYAAMDRETGGLLVAKNLNKRLPIASVAKIMTAVTALENAPLSLELTVSSAAAKIGEASMGLSYKEKLTLEDLLFGMMLPSGNDAAETIANGLGAGRNWFINMMNKKAQSLGMYDTYFFNPTGLDAETREETTFSTALDLLGLTNYALKKEEFAKIVATRVREIPYEKDKHKAFYLENILRLDQSYPGVKGVKPGLSDLAGETLVSYVDNHRKIIVVILGSQETKADAVKIYDFLLRNK